MDKVNILGVHVDMVNISRATDCIMRFLDEDKFHAIGRPYVSPAIHAHFAKNYACIQRRKIL